MARIAAAGLLWSCATGAGADEHRDLERGDVERLVQAEIRPLMREHDVPGMAVGVAVRGHRYVVNVGLADRQSGREVGDETIFELGSVSKTLTATLAAYAQTTGALSLADPASKYLPALAGTRFDAISLLDLATYTAGGLPLQFPDAVFDRESMLAYYRNWRSDYPPGTHRLYSNVSIGLFGHVAAASLGRPFAEALEGTIFPALGMKDSFVRVPSARLGDYAFGYAKDGAPVRVNRGPLDAEAYGVKSTAADMLRFVEANIETAAGGGVLERAIRSTHVGYHRLDGMVQCLGWERYAFPVGLDGLLAGNAPQVALQANPVTKLEPPLEPDDAMLLDKTGSTNGFGAYVAIVPSRRIGIVLLANRNYPIPARIRAAYRILAELARRQGEPTGP